MTRFLAGLLPILCLASPAWAGAIYPIDRASVLAGSRFDLKVEFDQVVPQDQITVTVGGKPAEAVLGRPARFLEREDGKPVTSWVVQGASLTHPGPVEVVATGGGQTLKVRWDVYATGPRKARNVILFIGDGLSPAHRTAARLLARGMDQGKYRGGLAFDDFPHTGLVGTSGMDSIITDSANSMSAYTTGHKSALNAMGVYASRAENDFEHPRVETLVELVKRRTKMAVGVVSDAEVEDATPAAMVAHTRRRARKAEIAPMFLDSGVDVLLGGGRAYFLPAGAAGSKRQDGLDPLGRARAEGYAVAMTGRELTAAAQSATRKLLGLFHPENMDGVLDRRFLRKGTVTELPDQPDLTEMTRAALDVLSRNSDGFVLMVEAGLIDKFSHRLDWERSVWDTIMLSDAVQVAREFAARRNDTLILVTADHAHGLSIVGTVEDGAGPPRDRVRTYAEAGFPDYGAPDRDGYPARPDPKRRLAIFFSDTPDVYESRSPSLQGPREPTVPAPDKKGFVANPAEKAPGAPLVDGNLPRSAEGGVHTMEDVVLDAVGPGSERVHGFMDNTEVFRVMVEALGLGRSAPSSATTTTAGTAGARK